MLTRLCGGRWQLPKPFLAWQANFCWGENEEPVVGSPFSFAVQALLGCFWPRHCQGSWLWHLNKEADELQAHNFPQFWVKPAAVPLERNEAVSAQPLENSCSLETNHEAPLSSYITFILWNLCWLEKDIFVCPGMRMHWNYANARGLYMHHHLWSHIPCTCSSLQGISESKENCRKCGIQFMFSLL